MNNEFKNGFEKTAGIPGFIRKAGKHLKKSINDKANKIMDQKIMPFVEKKLFGELQAMAKKAPKGSTSSFNKYRARSTAEAIGKFKSKDLLKTKVQ